MFVDTALALGLGLGIGVPVIILILVVIIVIIVRRKRQSRQEIINDYVAFALLSLHDFLMQHDYN